jgi:4-amino-4-deoxy-L-arabinose transferase-like glycosyltransferase
MLSVPALIVCVPVAHNDNIAAAFALCAYAALLNGSTDPPAVSSIIAAALTLAAAVSTKPFTILAVPGVCIYIMYAACRIGNGRQELFRGAARSAAVAITIVLTLLLWAAHCHSHSGRIWDTSGYEMAASPADPLWDSPKAAGRKARPTDYIITPLVFPIEMTIGHERGFSGNRIGPLLLVFFPLGIWGIRSLKREERTTLCFLIGSAAFYLLMFSPTAPKTRFHLFVWGIGAVVAAIGLQWTQLRRPCIARLCFAGFLLLASAGLLDACRHLYSFGHYLTQRSS